MPGEGADNGTKQDLAGAAVASPAVAGPPAMEEAARVTVPPNTAAEEQPSAQRAAALDREESSAPVGKGSSKLSALAPEFVPAGVSGEVEAESDDVYSILPEYHRGLLRGWFEAPNGQWVQYYVGRLKSYNTRSGYGFLQCPQAKAVWGSDVFIHKNLVEARWSLGQPVEFAVQASSRGQPQAYDVMWLPNLPVLRRPEKPSMVSGAIAGGVPTAVLAASTGVASLAGAAAVNTTFAGAAVGALGKSRVEAPPKPRHQRYLGFLKSVHPAQGFGFIDCEELYQEHKRDVYFDKSQLPQAGYRLGMSLEFTCCLNSRGQPQARTIDWDPIPLVLGKGATPDELHTGTQRRFAPATHDRLKSLLKMIQSDSYSEAVIAALNYSDGKLPAVDGDVDYATFVLDRLGPAKPAVTKIRAFMQLCLLLKIGRMLTHPHTPHRCGMLVGWFELLAEDINSRDEAVRPSYEEACGNIARTLKAAFADNPTLSDEALSGILKDALRRLEAKVPQTVQTN
mmetsp:Transcript_93159/g.268083  ORF Transcript_93159/g.268083 Transcript_93159/m.268083 type:complete len:510 (-) Transcript_93159:225-1754(-)